MPQRVVLIEDNPVDVKHLSDSVATARPTCRLEVFRDGSSALEFFSQYRGVGANPISLVLLDLTLPRVHGMDLLAFIKSREETRYIPLVVVTGTGSPDEIRRAYELGANSVIEKKNSAAEAHQSLRAVLDYWLNENLAADAQGAGSTGGAEKSA